jgi:hypothetical protein
MTVDWASSRIFLPRVSSLSQLRAEIPCITSRGPVFQSQMKSLLPLLTLTGALLLPQISPTNGNKTAFFAPDRPKAIAFFAPDRPKAITFFAPDRPKTIAFFAPDRPIRSEVA